ncbi:hypothetical protein DFR55_11450 [Herbinix hemicellulosilytica]|uniref:DUF4351 domain-containing protein n=1 Tax=Herbinix hemicellulosilytica TaxID=1564487 RepID=A0A0H5SJZ6_HERHM|nr:hypothetical protein [Herbinix hemicellulosilytica]RBP58168.1 hypothetical protein DFR55_11450 [Herbinix hemicellulosilytica]CRZ35832.1 hypothetical protein HHT355_2651 [Herbinix hemicellulosilytica]
MRITFQEESINEKSFNRIFQGVSFKEIGLDLRKVKEIVEVERIENYKLPLLMFLLEDDTLLHIEIMNDEIKTDLQSMFTYDMSIVLRYKIQVRTVILNFGSRQDGKIMRNFGSMHYEVQIVDLSSIDGDKVYEELSQKITSGYLLNKRDKLNLAFLPFMKHSVSFSEALRKVILLIESIKDEEERMAYVAVISEIISRSTGEQGVKVLKEYLMDTEVGIRIRDEGKKEGMRESIMIILLEKFKVLPDDVYYAIAEQKNENTLMKWLQNVTSICSVDELKKMVFNIE